MAFSCMRFSLSSMSLVAARSFILFHSLYSLAFTKPSYIPFISMDLLGPSLLDEDSFPFLRDAALALSRPIERDSSSSSVASLELYSPETPTRLFFDLTPLPGPNCALHFASLRTASHQWCRLKA